MMAFQTRTSLGVNAEINMIPLIDVMLVLLIVFMVTAPLVTYHIKVQLPRTAAPANTTPPQSIRLGIDRGGHYNWNGQDLGEEALSSRLAQEAARTPQPELHLYADKDTPYEPIARAMAIAGRAGLLKLGFESLSSAQ